MDMQAGLQAYRSLRRELEQSVLPLATSLDGAAFTFQASLHGLALQVGGYVAIEQDTSVRLAQVLALEPATADGAELELAGGAGHTAVQIRLARGSGAVLEGDGARAGARTGPLPFAEYSPAMTGSISP